MCHREVLTEEVCTEEVYQRGGFMILAADIGGTKLLFGLFEVREGSKLAPKYIRRYQSRQFMSLYEATEMFLSDVREEADVSHIQTACFSMAGPVVENSCFLVNLGWHMNAKDMKERFPDIKDIILYNDLEATAVGLKGLKSDDLVELTPEISSKETDSKAILAAGTGLGEALILGGKVFPSEGGHCEFGPRTLEEIRLWHFLHEHYGHVSYEHILSGAGLCRLALFVMNEKGIKKPGFDLLPEEISRRGLDGDCEICRSALDIYTGIMGAEAGNLALKSMALGGIYLGGGIPPEIISRLRKEDFIRSFRAKGRLSSLLEKIPVTVILNNNTALYGSAIIAAEKYGSFEGFIFIN